MDFGHPPRGFQDNHSKGTQPDAWPLASLTLAMTKSRGKTRHLRVYLICGLFDTLENRVVTSGLTLASILKHFLGIPTKVIGAQPSQKLEAA